MNFTNRITSTPFFDLDAYKDIARDEKGTKSALDVVLLAGLSCGAGLHGFNPFGWIDGAVFASVVFAAATAAAFIAAHKFDRTAWSWNKAARCVRILGYALAPGIFGVVGIVLGAKLVVAVMIWSMASYVYALRLAFDYEPESARSPIAVGVIVVAVGAAWGYTIAINGGLEFLLLLVFVAICVFHKAVARWLFGHADPTTKASKLDLSLRGEIQLQWSETRRLFLEKGWDVTVGEMVEAFTLLKTRRPAEEKEETPVEPPPLPVKVAVKEEPAGDAEEAIEATAEEREKETASETESEEEAPASGSKAEEQRTEGQPGDAESATSELKEPDAGREPDAVIKDEVATEAESVSESAAKVGPGVDDVVEKIFNEAISGYESTEAFRSEFKGRSVKWRGSLKQVEEFTYDTVFGGEAGVKAVIEVAEIATGYGKLPVEAVLRLPAERLQMAQEGVGAEIAFEGELCESDPYSRRVFLRGDLS